MQKTIARPHAFPTSLLRRSWSGLALVLIALVAAAPANATFPGANGTIAMSISGSVVGLRLDGSEPRVFRASEGVGRFSWSPNGEQLAGSGDGGVMVGNVGSSGPKVVVPERGTFLRSRVSWSRDGRRLVYSRGYFNGPEAQPLVVVGATGGSPAPITSNEGGAATYDEDADWSPTGDVVAFSRWRPEGLGSGLALVAGGGGPVRLLVSAAALGIEEPGSTPPVVWPSWSPDGRRLAFGVSETAGIYVVGADGAGLRRVATGAHPAWSPDGTLIAFRAGAGIRVVRPDGGGERVVKAEYEGAHLSWQAVRGSPPAIVSMRVAANPVVYLDPSQARIEREERRGRQLLGGNHFAWIKIRLSRRVAELELERALYRLLPGVRRGRRCVRARGRVRRSRRCTLRRRERPATLVTGPVRVGGTKTSTFFDGTWGGRRLAKGRYQLKLRAAGPAGLGRARSVKLRVAGSCLRASRRSRSRCFFERRNTRLRRP